jgi:hypothetical protein
MQSEQAALLEEVRAYCKAPNRSTVDFTQVMAEFVHISTPTLDWCAFGCCLLLLHAARAAHAWQDNGRMGPLLPCRARCFQQLLQDGALTWTGKKDLYRVRAGTDGVK